MRRGSSDNSYHVERAVNGVFRRHSPETGVLVKINNWFGSNWLGFSGKALGAVGVWNKPHKWTAAQKQELSNYQEGQILLFHRDTKFAKRHESLEVVRAGPESLVARKETGEVVSISPKQTRAFSVYERQSIEIATGDSLQLTANRRGSEFKATNGG